jgi:hypothetical protein
MLRKIFILKMIMPFRDHHKKYGKKESIDLLLKQVKPGNRSSVYLKH